MELRHHHRPRLAKRPRVAAHPCDEHVSSDADHDDGDDVWGDGDDVEVVPELVAEGADAGDDVDAMEELMAVREEWMLADDPLEFYRLRILGGAWTKAAKGVAADSAGGFACGGVAKDWSAIYRWPKQKTFAFARYTRAGAMQLAREFVRKSNAMVLLWVEGEIDPGLGYGPAVLAGYEPAPEFLAWHAEIVGMHHWCQRAAEELLGLAPLEA